MEKIEKKIVLATTTGSTSGGTIIIPNTGVTYSINLLLKTTSIDLGFFDTYEDELATGLTGSTIDSTPYSVTGVSSSRLNELRKFSVSGGLDKIYFTSTTSTTDGVNDTLTVTGLTASTYVYYIGGITYSEEIISNESSTTFEFTSTGYFSDNFVDFPVIKDEAKQNIIDKPEVSSDVFIIRQSLPVFENGHRLKSVTNIDELEFYAGGGHFNIINNT